MKKLVAIFKNKDIRDRILFTLGIILIFRIGASISVPGVTISKDAMDTTNVLALMNLMGGGALQNFSLFALGVSPYITSSIIIQLLSMDVLPALTELSKQGQTGRKKIEMATRYLTLVLGAVQAYGITVTMQNSSSITLNDTSFLGYAKIVIFLIAGSMLVMWMADQITSKGIGNGVSMIIFVGIIASLPTQIYSALAYFFGTELATGDEALIIQGAVKVLLYILAYLVIILFVAFVEKSIRKIPVQHSNKGGALNAKVNNTSFLPIKINSAGVIPVIFASSLMMAPAVIIGFAVTNTNEVTDTITQIFTNSALVKMPWFNGGTWYMPWGLIIYIVLTFAFSFFYSNLTINPERLADDFQKSGSYIPGIRPGNETQRYIQKVLNRVTFIGATALTLIAALPVVLTLCNVVPQSLALGGTGMIIVVGVALETMSQIDGLLASNEHANVI
ncbi:protein translocase subunit SecY [Firmicutes bacterium CAG:449]|nr:protein translocase subunit SecY [Firmicutes bacterium CAG:449]